MVICRFPSEVTQTTTELHAARARPTYDWSGRYVGAHMGWSVANFHNEFLFGGDDAPGTLGASSATTSQPLAGIFGGYNHQMGRFMVGGEADITFRTLNWTGQKNVFVVPTDADDGFLVNNRIGTTGTLRGRVGYAWDRSLFYAAAGLTLGEIHTDITPFGGPDGDLPNTTYSQSSIRAGWTAALGLENAFSPQWFGRAEFRYSGFPGSFLYLTDPALLIAHGPNTNKTTVSLTEGMVGIGYRF